MAAQNLDEMTAETTTNINEASPDNEAKKPIDIPFTLLNFLCPPKEEIKEEQEDENKQDDTNTEKKKKKIKFITGSDVKQAYTGFQKFLFERKLRELPWRGAFKILYKIGLFIFFLINLWYPIIVFLIKRENLGYNIVCSIISLIGLIVEIIKLILELRHCIRKCKQGENSSYNVESAVNNKPQENEDDFSYVQEAKILFRELIFDLLEELLIYPSIICNLYGFINERGWEFDNAIAIIDFILLLYSLAMDAIYAKIFHVWVVQKLIRNSYDAFYEVCDERPNKPTIKRKCCSPFTLSVPFSMTMVLMHWIVLAIIGVRIYVDNFSQRKPDDDQQMQGAQQVQDEPETGDYNSTSYTRYMIFCGAYLPFISTAVYILLNRYWFVEIYKVINGSKNWADYIPTSVKCFGFLSDLKAYIAVIFLMIPVFPFLSGALLSDYQNSDFEIEEGIGTAARVLTACFSVTFFFPNFQAIIIFIILIIIIIILMVMLCCLVLCNEDSNRSVYTQPQYVYTPSYYQQTPQQTSDFVVNHKITMKEPSSEKQ